MIKVKIKILLDIPGYTAGQVVTIGIDSYGTPLEKSWRRRFKDAKTDNCLEIIQPPAKTPKPKQQSKQEQAK